MPLHHFGCWRFPDENHNAPVAIAVGAGWLPEFQQRADAAQTNDCCSAGGRCGRMQQRDAAALLIGRRTELDRLYLDLRKH
jgi:hypothetical protein